MLSTIDSRHLDYSDTLRAALLCGSLQRPRAQVPLKYVLETQLFYYPECEVPKWETLQPAS